MIRLIVRPEPERPVDPSSSPGRHVRFIATLEHSAEFVVLSDQPLADGARLLIERGFDPDELITMRMAGHDYDSFDPSPLSYWARSTYEEGVRSPLTRKKWQPRPDALARRCAESQDAIFEAPATNLPEVTKALYQRTAQHRRDIAATERTR